MASVLAFRAACTLPVCGMGLHLSRNGRAEVGARVKGRLGRPVIRCEAAEADGKTELTEAAVPADTAAAEPAPKRVIRRTSPPLDPADNDSFEVRRVEGEGVAVEGVARVEKEEDAAAPLWKLGLLVGGDVTSLLLFAWIGRATHVSAAINWELLKTADPFVAGWITAAYFTKDYFPETPLPTTYRGAAVTTLKTWAIGVPLGIAIRSAVKGELPQTPFLVVSLASTLVIMLAWRAGFTRLTQQTAGAKAGDRQGNPFEFFQLLTSLVKRW